MTCRCGYRFVLDPQDTGGIADGKFHAILRRASANDSLYFTQEQLFTAFCQRKDRSSLLGSFISVLVLLLFLFFFFDGVLSTEFLWGALFVAFLLMGMFLILKVLLGGSMGPSPEHARKQFNRILSTWIHAKGQPAFLLEQPDLHQPPPQWQEEDIYNYGVERVLLVERPLLVDLLVKNGLHARERMLVMSVDGYPEYVGTHLKRILHEQTDTPVFLLHDATEAGMAMKERFRLQDWNGADQPILDLGLFPEDAMKLKGLAHRSPEKLQGRLPVDALSMVGLSGLLALAFAEEIDFKECIRRREEDNDGAGSYG